MGIFPFYSGMFPLLLLINLYRVYRRILSNRRPTLTWYPDAKKVNETPDVYSDSVCLYEHVYSDSVYLYEHVYSDSVYLYEHVYSDSVYLYEHVYSDSVYLYDMSMFCLFLLLYVPCQQLWSLRDGQFT